MAFIEAPFCQVNNYYKLIMIQIPAHIEIDRLYLYRKRGNTCLNQKKI